MRNFQDLKRIEQNKSMFQLNMNISLASFNTTNIKLAYLDPYNNTFGEEDWFVMFCTTILCILSIVGNRDVCKLWNWYWRSQAFRWSNIIWNDYLHHHVTACSNSHDVSQYVWTTAEYICNKNAYKHCHSMDRAILLEPFYN